MSDRIGRTTARQSSVSALAEFSPKGQHAAAVEAALAAERGLSEPAYAPLAELCRTLAGQMDRAGDEPSTRLTAAYLSALKDLRRAVDVLTRVEPAPPARTSSLARIRANHGRPA